MYFKCFYGGSEGFFTSIISIFLQNIYVKKCFSNCQFSHRTGILAKATLSFFESRLMFPNFQSRWLCTTDVMSATTTTTISTTNWRKISLSVSLSTIFFNKPDANDENNNLKDDILQSIARQLGWFGSCCSHFSDEVPASVKMPPTVPPTSSPICRTGCT